MKDLTISNIERQNILNNRFAVSKVQHLDIECSLGGGIALQKWFSISTK